MTRVQRHSSHSLPVRDPIEPRSLTPAAVDLSRRIVGESAEDRDLVIALRETAGDVRRDGSLLWGEPLG